MAKRKEKISCTEAADLLEVNSLNELFALTGRRHVSFFIGENDVIGFYADDIKKLKEENRYVR